MDTVAPPFANSDEGSKPLLSGLLNKGLLPWCLKHQTFLRNEKIKHFFLPRSRYDGTLKVK